MTEQQADKYRAYHRSLLKHLNIKDGDVLKYDDAMWLMMRAVEFAIESPTTSHADVIEN